MMTSQAEHWTAEQALLGPGVSEAVAWAGLVVEHASGAHLTDSDGRVYLDLMGGAGVNLVGHSHPDIVASLHRQLDKWVIGAHASQARLDALRGLTQLLPPELNRVQFYSGGAEAVEAAIRLAKSATGKFEILSFWRGFHGRTAAALAATGGARRGLGPAMTGIHTAPYAYCFRCPLKTSYPGCGLACVDLARETLREQSSGSLAAILVEPVQGRTGNVVPPPEYLPALRELADEHEALLIADESMTGLGRTGTILASQPARPDIVVLGKGLGNGYPVSAIAAPADLMSVGPFGQPSASSSSYGGFPLACAAVAAVTTIVRDQDLAFRARAMGVEFLALLRELVPETGIVGQVRALGLAIGIELVSDQDTHAPLDKERLRRVFTRLLEKGVVVMTGGTSLRLYPPLTIDESDLHDAAAAIASVLNT